MERQRFAAIDETAVGDLTFLFGKVKIKDKDFGSFSPQPTTHHSPC